MAKETPEANPPLPPNEALIAASLSDAELEAIDTTVLANSSNHWRKVALVVVKTEDSLSSSQSLFCLLAAGRSDAILTRSQRFIAWRSMRRIRRERPW